MAQADDLAWFEANRAFISSTYQGQWVLIKDRSIKGAYPSDQQALQAGFAMFGKQPFIVKQANAQETVHQVPGQ